MASKKEKRVYYHGEPFSWEIQADKSFFSTYANVPSDYSTLENIVWTLKRSQEDNDDEYLQVFWKDPSDGITINPNFTWNPSKHSFIVTIEPDDYAEIDNKDLDYFIVIAFKVSNYTNWLELTGEYRYENDNIIHITKDKLRS